MFTFNTTKSIVSGPGVIARIGELARPILGPRVLLVTDAGLIKLGLLEGALASLQAAGIAVAIYDKVEADPPEANILAGVEMAKAHGATGILAIGGGSPMDVAKVIALLCGSGEVLAEAYGVAKAKGPRLPLVLAPTTAGTGSEATPVAVITTGGAMKNVVSSPILLPDLAVLDADLTLGLPKAVTAATGVDAMVHAIEAYTSKNANNNPISRGLARRALQLLGANLRKVCENGQDRAARADMLLGSLLAGQAFANAGVGAVHALAYPLGGHYHIPHGLSNALVLPHVMRFSLPEANADYAEIAADAFPELAGVPQGKRAEAFIAELEALSQAIGLPQRLRDMKIPESALPLMASEAMKQTRILVNNPRPVSEPDAMAIYTAAY